MRLSKRQRGWLARRGRLNSPDQTTAENPGPTIQAGGDRPDGPASGAGPRAVWDRKASRAERPTPEEEPLPEPEPAAIPDQGPGPELEPEPLPGPVSDLEPEPLPGPVSDLERE